MQNCEPIGARTVLAMLTPSSNTVVEPYTSALAWPLFPRVSVHFGRFRVKKIALDADSDEQFRLQPILEAAELLADARPDVIAWNGTSASWLGFDTDKRLCAEITARTGIQATSAVLALNDILKSYGVRRIGLVSPYTSDVQQKIIANYSKVGMKIVAERHSGRSDNHSFAEVTEAQIAEMCRDVASAKPDVIIILCTNMRGPLLVSSLEAELGIPVLDSVAFTLWGCLKATGISMAPLAHFGRIFSGQREAAYA